MALFRAFGGLSIAFAFLLMSLRHFNKGAAAHGGHDIQALWVPAVFFFLYGVGFWLSRRWAALTIVAISAAPLLLAIYRVCTPPGNHAGWLSGIYFMTISALPEAGAIWYYAFGLRVHPPPN